MSTEITSDSIDAEIDDDNRRFRWLSRNAEVIKNDGLKDSDAWDRACSQKRNVEIQPLDADKFAVRFPDGDPHRILAVRNRERDIVAACSCDGFAHHGYCAHLFALALSDAGGGNYIAQRPDVANQLRADGAVSDVVDSSDTDDQGDEEKSLAERALDSMKEDDDVDDAGDDRDTLREDEDLTSFDDGQTATTDGGQAEAEIVDVEDADRERELAAAGPSDPFAKELSGDIPDRYVMTLGGDAYVRRAGYAAIARDAGLRVEIEDVEPAPATGWEYARYRATVRDQGGDILATDVGTARLECEDLSGAEGELDELAATRAARRALEWATGAGQTLQ